MGRYKDDHRAAAAAAAGGGSVDDDVNDDPIVQCARSWLHFKRSMASFSFSETASRARHDLSIVALRTWVRLRVYAQDTRFFQILQQSAEGGPRMGSGGGRTPGTGAGGSFADTLAAAYYYYYDLYRANFVKATTAFVLLLTGVVVLIASGGGFGGGGFVDPAVGVEGCPNQAETETWRRSCQPQWTGDVHGREKRKRDRLFPASPPSPLSTYASSS